MKQTIIVILTLILIRSVAFSSLIEKPDKEILSIELAMGQRNYEAALNALNNLDLKKYSGSYPQYLKSVCLFKLEKYSESLETIEKIMESGNQEWANKALYLKTDIFLKQKNYKSAAELFDLVSKNLLSEERKNKILEIYYSLAKTFAEKAAVSDNKNLKNEYYFKSFNLMKKTLVFDLPLKNKDYSAFMSAIYASKTNDKYLAIKEFENYLKEFDSNWSFEKSGVEKKIEFAGKYVLECRSGLASKYFESNNLSESKRLTENLISLVEKNNYLNDTVVLIRNDAYYNLTRIHDFLKYNSDGEFELFIKSARTFLEKCPDDYRTVSVDYEICSAYIGMNRIESALEELKKFINRSNFKINPAPEGIKVSEEPMKEFERLNQSAVYQTGELYFNRKNYDTAAIYFEQYINQFPNGREWSAAQAKKIDIDFKIGMDFLENGNYEAAEEQWKLFLKKYPLDARAPLIMFVFAEMEFRKGELELEKNNKNSAYKRFEKSIDLFNQLISKYPASPQANKAGLRITEILENNLERYADAVDELKKIRNNPAAFNKLNELTEKSLTLKTDRTFRTNENPYISLKIRNIEKFTVKLYKLDLSAYFKKYKSIQGIESLDLQLIEPDTFFVYNLDDYKKFKLYDMKINISMENAGVYAVTVSEDDYEAATLVIRSDIEGILKASRKQAFVYIQNMLTGKPQPDAEVIISDGTSIFAEGKTNKDGIAVIKHDNLKSSDNINFFAIHNNSAASDNLMLTGLQVSSGLTQKTYIYTDKPAYKQGETANIKAVIRDVKDGVYTVPEATVYLMNIYNPSNRLMKQDTVIISDYGTVSTKFDIPENAETGDYNIIVLTEKNKTLDSFNFKVSDFKLEKIKGSIVFDKEVYYRGETVKAEASVLYYYGSPVQDKLIYYTLPDGRELEGRTDSSGKFNFEFNTVSQTSEQALGFSVFLPEDNFRFSNSVFLAVDEFSIDVSISSDSIFTGENAGVFIKTNGANQKPVSKKIIMSIIKTQTTKIEPVISRVEWFKDYNKNAYTEITVETRPVITSEKGGASENLIISEAGKYIIRISGVDIFGNNISNEIKLNVSEDADYNNFRLASNLKELKEGENHKIELISGIKKSQVLLTFEGEEIIDYILIEPRQKLNSYTIDFNVKNEFFPNFTISALTMNKAKLYSSNLSFKVDRELKVSILPDKEKYFPGETAKIKIKSLNHLDKPASAEFSLALVNEALFALFEDNSMNISDYFSKDAERVSGLRLSSSISFSYSGITKKTVKDIIEESERERREQIAGGISDKYKDSFSAKPAMAGELRRSGKAKKNLNSYSDFSYGAVDNLSAPQSMDFSETKEENYKLSKQQKTLTISGTVFEAEDSDENVELYVSRKELDSASAWIAKIKIDGTGETTVEIKMPENLSEYRFTAKGISKETLAGQANKNISVQKNFFIECRIPDVLYEGDKTRPFVKIHNLTDTAGIVKMSVSFKTENFDGKTFTASLKVESRQSAEYCFEEFLVPCASYVSMEISAEMENSKLFDKLIKDIVVRPWGMNYYEVKSGKSSDKKTLFLKLNNSIKYNSQWMSIKINSGINNDLISLVLQENLPVYLRGRYVNIPDFYSVESQILASASVLKYLKSRGNETQKNEILENTKRLISQASSVQRNDGSWEGGEINIAVMYWALISAKNAGIEIDRQILPKAKIYIEQAFRRSSPENHLIKSVLLFALSCSGDADYSYANRLYRDRSELPPAALAFAALTFHNLQRFDYAKDIALLLAEKAAIKGNETYWKHKGYLYNWFSSEVEITALSMLALQKILPDNPNISKAAEFLLNRKYYSRYYPSKAVGPVAAALSEYFGNFANIKNNYYIDIYANDKKIKTVNSKQIEDCVYIDCPQSFLKQGENKIYFDFNGIGEFTYSAILEGFSNNFINSDQSDALSIGSKNYYHSPLKYKGKILTQSSFITNEIEFGDYCDVYIDIDNEYRYPSTIIEEFIPAGAKILEKTITGNFSFYKIEGPKITFFYKSNQKINDIRYSMINYNPGSYRVLPSVIRNADNVSQYNIGKQAFGILLAKNEKSSVEYKMSLNEHYYFGAAYYEDGFYDSAIVNLSKVFKESKNSFQPSLSKMLLWMYSDKKFYNAEKVVECFEIIKEKEPDLFIPFDKILIVARAYYDIKEYERSYLTSRAIIESSFYRDVQTAGVLQNENEFLASVFFTEKVISEYPALSSVTSALLGVGQALYAQSENAHNLFYNADLLKFHEIKSIKKSELYKPDVLAKSVDLSVKYLALNAENPCAKDAAFSLTNAYRSMNNYEMCVQLADAFAKLYEDDIDLASDFVYLKSLGYFSMQKLNEALKEAESVAAGESKNKNLASYIIGQIYHTNRNTEKAIEYYEKIKDIYPDAAESIDHFKKKNISFDEINIFKSSETPIVKLKFKSVDSIDYLVYKVDLMKLVLIEKNLDRIANINLSGITPTLENTIKFEKSDYDDSEISVGLDIKKDGAYLMICRSGDLFASGLILISKFNLSVDEEFAGRVRVNITDNLTKEYKNNVYVKVIGSKNSEFVSGKTDLRGIFTADGIQGITTVICKDENNNYAFYKGKRALQDFSVNAAQTPQKGFSGKSAPKYDENLEIQNQKIILKNSESFNNLLQNIQRGVQAQSAY